MPTKYCPHCAASNSYSVNPPSKCEKCKESFASAFREVTAAKPARKIRQIFVDEDGNEVDAPEQTEIVVVRKPSAKTKPKGETLAGLLRAKRLGKDADEGDDSDDEDEAEASEDIDEDDEVSRLDPYELAAALNPDDLLSTREAGAGDKASFSTGGESIRLGDLANIQRAAADAAQAKR